MSLFDPGNAILYNITPRGWGLDWFVMAYSEYQALQCLKTHLQQLAEKEASDPRNDDYDSDRQRFAKWKNATPDKLPDGYTIKVHEELKIVGREIS
ncbi:MAG: hypothetical protein WC341_16835 [Bacteroidales bacterium]|jgi:hypothetical protein